MFLIDHLWIIPALPLLGAVANGLIYLHAGARWPKAAVNIVALGATGLAFAAVLELFREFSMLPATSVVVRNYFP